MKYGLEGLFLEPRERLERLLSAIEGQEGARLPGAGRRAGAQNS